MQNAKIICICWHSVEPDSINPEFLDGSNPTVSLFREQIRFVIQRYTPISIRQFMDLSKNRSLLTSYKKPPVFLSFDDGFKNVIDLALPVLNEFGVPASFFVIGQVLEDPNFVPWYIESTQLLRRTSKTSIVYRNTTLDLTSQVGRRGLRHLVYGVFQACQTHVEFERSLNDLSELLGVKRPVARDLDTDLRFVNGDDLAKLGASSLLNVGSHAMTHRFLTNLSRKEQRIELEQSQILLSNITASYFPAFAYPGGCFNADTVAIAKDTYKCAFGLFYGSSYRSIHMYPRVVIGADTPSHLAYAIGPLRLTYLRPLMRLVHAGRMW